MGLSKVSGSGIDANVITPANLHSTFVLPVSKVAKGPGSGLDADTLDGEHGAYYLDYNNFTNVPAISSDADTLDGQQPSYYLDYTNFTNKPSPFDPSTLANVATSGSYADLSNTPTLANVATSGSYNDLSNKPTIPAAVTNNNQLTNGAGYITSADGGNADTVDNLHAASFLRSDTSDTFTGTLSISGSINNASTAGNSGAILGNLEVGYGGPYNSISARSNSSLHLNYNSSGTVFVGASNTVWHAGNDGSGSGLDADTLDGQHGTYYLDYNNLTNVPSGSTDADTIDGIGFRNTGSNSGVNADNVNSNCNAYYTSGVTNFSGNSNDGHLYGGIYSTTWQHQIAGDYRSGQIAIRGKNNGTWQSWHKVWSANNDGSGSGLDADTVDGIQGANFVRSDTGDTLSGNYNTSGTWLIGGTYSNNAYSSVSSTRLLFGGGNDQDNYFVGTNLENYGGNYTKLDLRWHTGIRIGAQPSYGGTRIFNNEDLSTLLFSVGRGDGNTRVESGSLLIGGNTAWHAGNDGSGSGLDADTVDGIQGGNFLRSDTSDVIGGTLSYHSNTARLQFRNTSYNTYLHIGGWTSSNDNNISRVRNSSGNLHIDSAANGNLYFNHYSGGSILMRGQTAWHAGNDGSGSGLDADTVDGIQGGNFVRSDTSDTMNGELNVTRNSGVTGGSAPSYSQANIEVQTSSNHVPAIGFHRGGYSATTLYENNGELYVNAWVSRAQNGKLVSFGNDGSGSGLDADLLDGMHGSSYVRSNGSSTTISTPCKFTASSGAGGSGSSAGFEIESNSQYMLAMSHTTNGQGPRITMWEGGIASYRCNIGWSPSGYVYLSNNEVNRTLRVGDRPYWVVNSTSYTMWHTGNDGSGSGLDADTVKGGNPHLRGQSIYGYYSNTYTPGYGNSSEGAVLRGTSISYFSKSADIAMVINRNNNGDCVSIRYGGTEKGSIEVRSNRTYFRTSSDYRLKTNVLPIANAVDKIKALKPSKYNWIDTGETDYGFLAHEIQPLIPGAATGEKDEVDENGDPVYQKVDQATIIPFLTAALKEAITRIEVLEERLTELEK